MLGQHIARKFFEQMIARENTVASFAFVLTAAALLAAGGDPVEAGVAPTLIRISMACAGYVVFLKLYCYIRDSAAIRNSASVAPVLALTAPVFVALIVVAIHVSDWFGPDSVRSRDYATAVGGYKRLVLSDNSVVELNTASRIRVRYEKGQRLLVLQAGEARFTVVRDKDQPFVVMANRISVRDVGTIFAVRLYDRDAAEVLVQEGRVQVSVEGRSSAVAMSAGERTLFRDGGVAVQRIGTDAIGNRLTWTEGRLVFSGETIAAVVEEFNRYNNTKIVIDDPSLNHIVIGGTFPSTRPDEFLSSLQAMLPVTVTKTTGDDGQPVLHVRGTQTGRSPN